MKKVEISFRHFDGAGPLSIYWTPGPYGIAIEASKGAGVAWFSPNGEILGVEFDHVCFEKDAQNLELRHGYSVGIRVKKGKVVVKTHCPNRKKAA